MVRAVGGGCGGWSSRTARSDRPLPAWAIGEPDVGPVGVVFDEAGADWVVADVGPFLGVVVGGADTVIEEVALPMDAERASGVVFPIFDCLFHAEAGIPGE